MVHAPQHAQNSPGERTRPKGESGNYAKGLVTPSYYSKFIPRSLVTEITSTIQLFMRCKSCSAPTNFVNFVHSSLPPETLAPDSQHPTDSRHCHVVQHGWPNYGSPPLLPYALTSASSRLERMCPISSSSRVTVSSARPSTRKEYFLGNIPRRGILLFRRCPTHRVPGTHHPVIRSAFVDFSRMFLLLFLYLFLFFIFIFRH